MRINHFGVSGLIDFHEEVQPVGDGQWVSGQPATNKIDWGISQEEAAAAEVLQKAAKDAKVGVISDQ